MLIGGNHYNSFTYIAKLAFFNSEILSIEAYKSSNSRILLNFAYHAHIVLVLSRPAQYKH